MSQFFKRFAPLFLFYTLFIAGCSQIQPTPLLGIPVQATEKPTQTPTPIPTPKQTVLPPTATMEAVCIETTGTLEMDVINTPLLDKPMRYEVYLPPCYNFDESRHYPVLYLLHGQNSTEEQWIRIGATGAANRIINSKETAPFIIVFPFDYSYKQPSEYKFEEVFTDLLLPRIDRTYRTQPNSAQRAIGGLSRGGAWALHIGALHPDLFGAIGGHSPAIFYADEKLISSRLLEISASQMPRIWLDIGDNDSEYGVITPFELFLTKNEIPHEWHEYIGWHDEKYWSAHVEEYLIWYAQNWK